MPSLLSAASAGPALPQGPAMPCHATASPARLTIVEEVLLSEGGGVGWGRERLDTGARRLETGHWRLEIPLGKQGLKPQASRRDDADKETTAQDDNNNNNKPTRR